MRQQNDSARSEAHRGEASSPLPGEAPPLGFHEPEMTAEAKRRLQESLQLAEIYANAPLAACAF